MFRHALAFDEFRAALCPTLMHIDAATDPFKKRMRQVWFSGSHSDLGKMRSHGTELVNIALRWMIGEMKANGIRFDPKLEKYHFRGYTESEWETAKVHSTWNIFWKSSGKMRRIPGGYSKTEMKTNEEIHPSAIRRLSRATFGGVQEGEFGVWEGLP